MKLKFGVTLVLMAVMSAGPLFAGEQSAVSTDTAAVRATVRNYIEAYYSGNVPLIEKTLHPNYVKHTISTANGRTRMTEKTGLQMIQDVRHVTPVPASERREKITVLDVAGDIATAKLETPQWTDYVSLTKVEGEWKVVSVLLRLQDES